jgi:hypothetical protein
LPTGSPVKTIFNAHQNGVAAIDISSDSMHLVTLSEVRVLQMNNGLHLLGHLFTACCLDTGRA